MGYDVWKGDMKFLSRTRIKKTRCIELICRGIIISEMKTPERDSIKMWGSYQRDAKYYFYAPLEKGGIWYVGLSVCRPSVFRSISFDSFTWSIPNLVQGLPSMSRWSLLIFRSHVQRSRSNHSSQPTVLSGQYLWHLQLINTILNSGVALNE